MTTTSLLDVPGLSKRSGAFLRAFADLIDRTGLDAEYLAAAISNESGFRPEAINKSGGASGLIQFMPATAVILGTTIDAIRAMSDVEQLEYVEKFFRLNGRKMPAARDISLQIFMPAFVGKPDSAVIARKDTLGWGDPPKQTTVDYYKPNAGLDTDHDGALTVGEVRAVTDHIVASARKKPRLPVPGSPPEGGGSSGSSSNAGGGSPSSQSFGEMLVSGILVSGGLTALWLFFKRGR